jgi:cytidyltransferase-like protein
VVNILKKRHGVILEDELRRALKKEIGKEPSEAELNSALLGKRVLAAGKFDILHLGHLAYLNQARQLVGEDGELVVVIALDKTIEKQRGAPPV